MGDVVNMKPYRFKGMEMPERMRASLLRYVNDRVVPGAFLRSVISNDLSSAVAMADEENLKVLPVFVCWLTNEAPSECWGSWGALRDWVEGGNK